MPTRAIKRRMKLPVAAQLDVARAGNQAAQNALGVLHLKVLNLEVEHPAFLRGAILDMIDRELKQYAKLGRDLQRRRDV